MSAAQRWPGLLGIHGSEDVGPQQHNTAQRAVRGPALVPLASSFSTFVSAVGNICFLVLINSLHVSFSLSVYFCSSFLFLPPSFLSIVLSPVVSMLLVVWYVDSIGTCWSSRWHFLIALCWLTFASQGHHFCVCVCDCVSVLPCQMCKVSTD